MKCLIVIQGRLLYGNLLGATRPRVRYRLSVEEQLRTDEPYLYELIFHLYF